MCACAPPQIMFEGIRGPSFEGDIAIDDVSITKGKCKQDNSVASTEGRSLHAGACLSVCLSVATTTIGFFSLFSGSPLNVSLREDDHFGEIGSM
ncbi:hypothetical protein CRUP_005594 [Coryphaenoides rupestris]|nr:hypothetical protein CRUP_005594 [Coryphaenoides rupestris]